MVFEKVEVKNECRIQVMVPHDVFVKLVNKGYNKGLKLSPYIRMLLTEEIKKEEDKQ